MGFVNVILWPTEHFDIGIATFALPTLTAFLVILAGNIRVAKSKWIQIIYTASHAFQGLIYVVYAMLALFTPFRDAIYGFVAAVLAAIWAGITLTGRQLVVMERERLTTELPVDMEENSAADTFVENEQ